MEIKEFVRKAFSGSFIFLAYFIFSIQCAAQTQSIRETYQDGDGYFRSEDYREAVYYFLDIVQKGFVNANVQYKIGACYLNIPGEEDKAIPYLEEAVKKIALKYDPKNLQEKKAPIYSLFYLGNAYRIDNQLDKALDIYDQLVKSPGYNENTFNFRIVENEVKSCQRAKIIQDSPVDVTWINLGDSINTKLSETNPVISGDESVLVYLEGLKFYNAVYFTRKIGDTWSLPENISPQIVSDGEFYPTSLSYDGKELYLVKKEKSGGDIYCSKYYKGKWGPAKKLSDNINSSKDENYASISSNGQILYFSSNRHDSKGGYDIFRSNLGKNGEWGKAENIGIPVNTKNDEISPSITADGKTLFFSSNGHFSMGGFDIFYSTLKQDGTWSEPVNIGYPINTTGDNVGFQVLENGKSGYISRTAKDSKGKQDIYKVEINSRSKQFATPTDQIQK